MKAIRFHQPGNPEEVLKLEEISQPTPSATQVLVEVKASPVNPSDLFFIRGAYRRKPIYPQTAGLEGAGIIVDCGSAVTSFKAGDRVAFRLPGTWSEYCLAEEDALIPIDRDIPFTLASQIGLNPMTAIGLLSEAPLEKGDCLLVDAASSTVSGLVIQLAAARGIRVIALVRDARHFQELKALGVETTFLQNDPDLVRQLTEVTAGKGIQAFFDAIGGKLLEEIIPLMAQYATIVCYGNISNNEKAGITNGSLVYRNLTLKGFGIDRWLSLRSPEQIRKDYAGIVEDLYAKKILLREIPSVPLGGLLSYLQQPGHSEKVIVTNV
ncbi:MAG TPA: zinc-dependent alcohol dehydrogenase family protein [Puia sp.]|nr:zinc-dependent alcohol dehydrogenase family protein [Puia sp.]